MARILSSRSTRKSLFTKNPNEHLAYRKGAEHEISSRFKLLHKDTPEQTAAVKFSIDDMTRCGGPNNLTTDFIIPNFAVDFRRP